MPTSISLPHPGGEVSSWTLTTIAATLTIPAVWIGVGASLQLITKKYSLSSRVPAFPLVSTTLYAMGSISDAAIAPFGLYAEVSPAEIVVLIAVPVTTFFFSTRRFAA